MYKIETIKNVGKNLINSKNVNCMHMLVSLKNMWHVKCHNDKFHTSNQLNLQKP